MNNFGKFGTALALASFVVASYAQTGTTNYTVKGPVAYELNKKPANDNWGNGNQSQVWKNGSDELCWQDNFWTPATANVNCVQGQAQPQAKLVQTRQPITGSFTLGADGAYALGKSVITPKGKAILDTAIAKLKNYDLDSLVISGYTDSQGNDKINVPLSKARATSVFDYMASAGGIPTSKMSHEGYGASNFVVDPKTCPGMKVNGRPVSRTVCEAPNRRVEVKFSGYAKEMDTRSK